MTAAFQQLLLDLALIAGPVEAQSFEGPKTTGSKEEDPILYLNDYPADPAWWLGRWVKCHSERSQREILGELQNLVDSLKWSRRYDGLERGTKEWRRMIATEVRLSSYETIAWRCRVSSKTIAKCLKEFPDAGLAFEG